MEQQLKQRLIGVTVIVALIVIFVPMLFDSAEDRSVETPEGIPPIPSEAMETKPLELPKSVEDMAPKETDTVPESGYKIIPLTDEAPEQDEQNGAPKEVITDAEGAGESEGIPLEEEMPPVEENAAAQTQATPAPKAARAEKPEPEGKKQKTGTPAAAQPAQPKNKAEVGTSKPAKTAPASVKADAASATTKKPAKKVATETPAATKSSAEASSVPGAWAVQTGSFTTEAKALSLMEKLRQSKFPAFVERVQGVNGTMYRVKVGPELERGRAEQTQKQIEGNVGIKGIIVPQR